MSASRVATLALLARGSSADLPPPFLFGTYSDPPYGCLFQPNPGCGGRSDYKDLPETEVIHGYNLFTPYLSEAKGHNASSWAAIEAYLERAAQLGVQVSYALNQLCGHSGCGAGQRELIRQEVLRVRNYSAIHSWYLVDEPGTGPPSCLSSPLLDPALEPFPAPTAS
jgi:hypothetical protein